MRKIVIYLVTAVWTGIAVCGCELVSCGFASITEKEKTLSVASWNVQTFFDSVSDGNEYSEFLSAKSKWSKEKYQKRVEKLCEIISLIDADILAFEEVEKEGLAYDIANHLDLQANRKKYYPYSCFACEENGIFGNLVISRYPLKNMTLHNLEVRDDLAGTMPKLRPLLEVDVMTSEKEDAEKIFTLFVCHWKSKASDDGSSEIWRNYQESLLAQRMQNLKDEKFIACGDFNQDLKGTKIIFRGSEKEYRVNSCWSVTSGEGSYFYDEQWEKIDHIFYSNKILIENFSVINNGPHVTSDGKPFRYTVYSGEGYSDHFPIKCFVRCKL